MLIGILHLLLIETAASVFHMISCYSMTSHAYQLLAAYRELLVPNFIVSKIVVTENGFRSAGPPVKRLCQSVPSFRPVNSSHSEIPYYKLN